MNPWNLITGLLTALSVAAALKKIWKDRKREKGGCCGSCSGCSRSCR